MQYSLWPFAKARLMGSTTCRVARRWVAIALVAWLLPGLCLAQQGANPSKASLQKRLKRLYVAAMAQKQKKQWPQAASSLSQLLPLFTKIQAQIKPNSQPYHLMTIGRADVMYHLAEVTWKQKKKRRSCLLHKAIADAISTLPPPWRSWSVRPELPQRFQASAQHLGNQCKAVPSVVILQIQPKDIKGLKVVVRDDWGGWQGTTKRRLLTRKLAISLRVEAPGYLPQFVDQRFVPRWRTATIKVILTPKPKVPVNKRVVAPRTWAIPPPPPTPFYQTWWFWTITGTVVVGTVTGVILYATLPRQYGFVKAPNGGFEISRSNP